MREYFPFMALDSFFSFVVTEGGAAWVCSFGIGERDLIIITFSREIKPMGELKTQTCRSLDGDHIWPFVFVAHLEQTLTSPKQV